MKITLQSMDMGSPNTVERYHQLYLCVHGMYVEAIAIYYFLIYGVAGHALLAI